MKIAAALASISVLSSSEGSFARSFAGVFDQGIYDQTPIRAPATEGAEAAAARARGPEEAVIDDPLELLMLRKQRQLTEKYISTLREKIRGFNSAMGGDGEELRGFDRICEDFRRNPFAAGTTVLYTVTSWFEGLFGKPRRDRWGERRLADAKKADNGHLEFEILKIKAEIQAAFDSLRFEPVFPLEELYVRRKAQLPAPLQAAVERSLILYRECTGHLLAIERTFVEQALALALRPKRILVGDRARKLGRLIRRTRDRFSTFDEAVQGELVSMVVDIANFSMVPDDYDGARRVVRYFWGKPGGGKTTSVQKVAEILGLPYEKVSIRSMEDLSGPPLRGEDRLSFSSGNKHGWFISPLLKRQAAAGAGEPVLVGGTYNNAILLIDDIDLELGADEVLSTLKLYLDPTTRIFHSPYFLSPIDVSRMHIVVTSNQQIPGVPTDGSMDKYAALRSRVKQVRFPICSITEDSPVLRAYVAAEARAREIAFADVEVETSLAITAAREMLRARGEEPDMRNMRAQIADLMTDAEIASVTDETPLRDRLERARLEASPPPARRSPCDAAGYYSLLGTAGALSAAALYYAGPFILGLLA